MAELRATPYANPLTGLSNDVIQGLLGYMKDKQRTQQMQGLASLLESTGIPKTVERAAYADSPTGLLNALTNVNRANVPLLKPETADALMTLAPVPLGTNKGAMALGRASERYAEKVVPQIMERGGLPAGLLEGMASQTISPLTVYHGSPAKFNKFDATKIGTGEGAQVYGYGHYVAENPAVAQQYQKNLSDFDILVDGKPFNPDDISHMASMTLWQAKGDKKKAIETLKEATTNLKRRNVDWADNLASQQEKEIEYLQKAKTIPKYEEVSKGNFYEIYLPDEQIAQMIDWDKPLTEQPEVWNKLKESGFYPFMGSDLGRVYKPETIDEAKELLKAGVTGIKYFDEQSRVNPYKVELFTKKGKYAENVFDNLQQARDYIAEKEAEGFSTKFSEVGTRNFVVFPEAENLLSIQKINQQPITSLLE